MRSGLPPLWVTFVIAVLFLGLTELLPEPWSFYLFGAMIILGIVAVVAVSEAGKR